MNQFHATTVVAVRRNNQTAIAADGQVTVENHIVKNGARKVRRLGDDRVIAGFAGGAADAITLFEKFEDKLSEHRGNLRRAAVELAKEWRTDRALRRLEALLLVADAHDLFMVSGNGDVLEPDEGIAAIGSGGTFAQSAALALLRHTEMSARDIAQESLHIAASICIYTNDNISVEVVEAE